MGYLKKKGKNEEIGFFLRKGGDLLNLYRGIPEFSEEIPPESCEIERFAWLLIVKCLELSFNFIINQMLN